MDTPVHLILISSKSTECSSALSVRAQYNNGKCTNLSSPCVPWLKSLPISLCLLPIVMSSPTASSLGRGPGGSSDQYRTLLLVLCAASLGNFSTLGGSTHQSALQLHHGEFFTRGKLSLVIAPCIRRDVPSPELFAMQHSHPSCSEKLILNRMVQSQDVQNHNTFSFVFPKQISCL